MIIVELKGGFGNQLFQYAAGLSLAKYHQTELRVDPSQLANPDSVTGTIRQTDLFNLSDIPAIANKKDLHKYHQKLGLSKFKDKILPLHKRNIYKEKSNKFDKNFFKAGASLLLKGNRQSELYFNRYENYIRQKLVISDTALQKVKEYGENLKHLDSVSLHIRRGDYLTAIALEWLGLLPLSYYENAIEIIAAKIPNCKFYIFSDDIDWVQNNLIINYEHDFVSNIQTTNAMEDFHLMSSCKHNIIANSTFSWWAAWLNTNQNKMIIAPKKWFSMENINTDDLIPKSWITL